MHRALVRLGALLLLAAPGMPLQQADAAPPAVASPSASSPASGFAAALAPRAFVFPRDHGPHGNFRLEWWYVTGNLDAADGERFGFELTFFRVALVPATAVTTPTAGSPLAPSEELASAWRAREIYVAHFAVTDVARHAEASSSDGAKGEPAVGVVTAVAGTSATRKNVSSKPKRSPSAASRLPVTYHHSRRKSPCGP